jgi:hypothetical protein
VRPLLVLISIVAVAACARNAPLKLSSGGKRVHIAKSDPPPGAHELGPIVGEDGDPCEGLDSERGTYSRALIRLRNRAAARGGDYVEIMTLTEPHQETRLCYDGRFVIRGMLYDVPEASEPAESASDSNTCDPPCSPGFACDEGACEPVCNPECPAGQACRADRTCGPPS